MLEDAFKQVLADAVTAVLKPRGFKKKRWNYTRPLPGLVWTVQVQRSQWNDSNHLSFTLNCGVYVVGVAPLMWGKPDPTNPGSEHFSVGGRIGAFEDPDGVDLWWELRADDIHATTQQSAADIRSRREQHVLPFLDRFPASRRCTQRTHSCSSPAPTSAQ